MNEKQRGFSLVELSIVILIMGLLLGGLMGPLATQRENARLKDAREQLQLARTAVEGFALTNGYLPCPATPASTGFADPSGGGCQQQHGFLPAGTLGLSDARNDDNLLLDSWGSPLRYSVSRSDVDGDGNWDFVTAGEMRDVTMPLLQPDLVICSTAAGATATACSGSNVTLADRVPALVFSMGKDWANFTSADQIENAGAVVGGGPSGRNYAVAGNDVFVSRNPGTLTGSEYDDLLLWISESVLYGRLVASGQLP